MKGTFDFIFIYFKDFLISFQRSISRRRFLLKDPRDLFPYEGEKLFFYRIFTRFCLTLLIFLKSYGFYFRFYKSFFNLTDFRESLEDFYKIRWI